MSFSRDIAAAIRTGAIITVGSMVISLVAVAIWMQAQSEIHASEILFMAATLPLLITPPISFVILRDRIFAERLARENYRLAHMDELTGLPNRRAFFNAARQLQARAAFLGQYFCCAIADVDNFKRVNDDWGHDVGDQVLREISVMLNTHMPADCVIARLGGEEFALAGMFASEADAQRAMNRIVALIAYRPVRAAETVLTVTISLGYCKGSRTDEMSSLLSTADRALYAAKRSGKNRALSFEQSGPPRTASGTAA